MLTFLVLRTGYIAMLLRSLGSFTYVTCCYAAGISEIVSYVTCASWQAGCTESAHRED